MPLRNILAPRQQVQTGQGLPLAGGKVFLYVPGTTDFITSYVDSALVVPHSNPVKLSGSGRANIWISRDCDLRITDRTGLPAAEGNLILEELNANPDALGTEESGGLIQNGSFEDDADADTIPDFWTLVSEAGATNAIDTSESTDGAQSFRFTSSGVGGGSLTTTNFFPVNDVDDLRVNFDLRSSLATVRNIVRVEWYDISMVSISNSDIYDSTANPLTFTSKAFTVTPPALARFAMLRLIGIDPSVALSGSTFYDRVSVFYPAVVSGIFDNLTLANNDIISTNTNGDINLTPNGTGRTVVKNFSAPTAMRIRADIVTATPPVAEAVTGGLDIYDLDESDPLARIGYDGSNTLRLVNLMHGALLQLRGEDAGGVVRNILSADPDADTDLYGVGVRGFGVDGLGNVKIYSTDNDDISTKRLQFLHADGTRRATVGLAGTDVLGIRNEIHGGNVEISGENASGAQRLGIQVDPDGNVRIYDPESVSPIVLETMSGSLGGILVLNTLTGIGLERVATESDIPIRLHKTADQSVTSSATLVDDTHLAGYPLEADKYYKIEGYLSLVQTGGNFKYNFQFTNAPQTSSVQSHATNQVIESFVNIGNPITSFRTIVFATDGILTGITFVGFFRSNAATGGTMDFQWAQQISDVDPTTVHQGSWLEITKMD